MNKVFVGLVVLASLILLVFYIYQAFPRNLENPAGDIKDLLTASMAIDEFAKKMEPSNIEILTFEKESENLYFATAYIIELNQSGQEEKRAIRLKIVKTDGRWTAVIESEE